MNPGTPPRRPVVAVPRPAVRSAARRAWWAVVWVAALACGLSACNDVQRNSDMHFGESYHQVFSNQVLNPDAGDEGTPVTGLDGKKAANIMARYQNWPSPPKGNKESSGGATDAVLFTPKDSGTSDK
ncbi:hypothetical protein [Desulfolutivibrio sulfoxidireducens]|uniref:hypothetical protein n=1 Tax=Desulfolutivibrio sulfoxidireducens TaxID=2773299 RepID=UPI00159DEFF1|nr:hypothetical protein [Desulfolutivibrio sulfoxidireducens]QLA17090.1 hypothetical protein GD605_13810 [Desulfolutivibrio sulfoxidireducens]